MKIILKNFRCHINSTFIFPDEGFISLTGPNGAGKSSILAAISFALYGKIPGKNKSIYSHGKTTASVELEYMDLKINRSAKPKRLQVSYQEKEYEDADAQSIVNTATGMTYQEFITACFIIQRSSSISVISMSSSEQTKFVETLAGSEGSAEEAKKRTKDFIKTIEHAISEIKGEIKALVAKRDEKLALYESPPLVPDAIENGVDPDSIRTKLSNLEDKMQEVNTKMEKIRKRLDTARKEEKKSADLQTDIVRLTSEIDSMKERLSNIQHSINESVVDDAKTRVVEITDEMASLKAWVEHLKEKERYTKAVAEFWKEIATRTKQLEKELVSEGELESMKQAIEEAEVEGARYEEQKAVITEMQKRKKEAKAMLATLFKDISANLGIMGPDTKTPNGMLAALYVEKERLIGQSKIAKVCPCCGEKVVVSLAEMSIETIEDDVDYTDDPHDHRVLINSIAESISKITEVKKDFSIKIPELGPAPESSLSLCKIYTEKRTKRDEYEKLKNKGLSLSLEKKGVALEEFNTTRQETIEEAETALESLETEYRELGVKIETAENNEKEAVALKSNIGLKEKTLKQKKSNVAASKGEVSIVALEKSINRLIIESTDISRLIAQQRTLLDSLSEYEKYTTTALEIEGLDESIKEAESRYAAEELRLDGFAGLIESEKEAEVLALEETVASINEHARIYLDSFFQDPITVRLECAKEGKGKKGLKLQLNTFIEYKGETYTNIEQLSGGELQRSEMAFVLAVNDMINGKLLIFDESFNELDSLTNTEVLSLVRDTCAERGKLVLIVSHEAVRGVFDEEIEVSHN
jgi:DNA repair exonuclease SbcCD ATPase subunit